MFTNQDLKNDFENVLKPLLELPGASGYEDSIQDFTKHLTSHLRFSEYTLDRFGNSIVKIYRNKFMSSGAHKLKIGIFTHADEISATVMSTNIEKQTVRIKCFTLSKESAVQQDVQIRTTDEVWKTFSPIFQRVKLQGKPELEEFEAISLDCSKEEFSKILIGCPVVMVGNPRIINDKYLQSKSLDNRVGIYIAIKVIEILTKLELPVEITFVNACREEIGHHGIQQFCNNNKLETDYNFVLDTTNGFNSFNNNLETATKHNNVSVGGGVVVTNGYEFVDQKVHSEFINFVQDTSLKYQQRFIDIDNITDCDSVFKKFGKTLLLQVPTYGMHSSKEMCELSDVVHTINSIVEFVKTKC